MNKFSDSNQGRLILSLYILLLNGGTSFAQNVGHCPLMMMIDTMIFKENHKINYHSPLHLSKSLEMLFFLPGVDQTPPTSPMIAHLIQPLPWMSDTYQPKRRMTAMASATNPEGFYCSMSRKFILFGKDGDGDYLSDDWIPPQD